MLREYTGRIPAGKLPELDQMLGDEERNKFEEAEDYEQEIWSERAKIEGLAGVSSVFFYALRYGALKRVRRRSREKRLLMMG